MNKILIRDRFDEHELIRQTLDFYERNAEKYGDATAGRKISNRYRFFLGGLPKSARILDAGCGGGRDSLAFLRMGYDVSAFDASPALCRLSSKSTGVPTRQLRFQEFDEVEKYDAVWACASLLHVPRLELPDCISRLIRGLRPGGVMYMSFKHGAGERIAPDGRFYSDLTTGDLQSLLNEMAGIRIVKLWSAMGTDFYRAPTRWVHAVIRKT